MTPDTAHSKELVEKLNAALALGLVREQLLHARGAASRPALSLLVANPQRG